MFAIAEISKEQDRKFLDQMYQHYYSMLYQVAFSIIQDKFISEDVITDAMLSLFSLVPKLRAMEDWELTAYLRTTVRRAAYKTYKEQRKQNATEVPTENSILFSLSAAGDTPDDALIQSEDFQMLRDAVTSLPERDRRLLYLKYAAGLSAEEIGELTGESAAAVRMRLSRARRKVLRLLEEGGGTDG